MIPLATNHAELAALPRTVDELRRAAVPVTAVDMEDRNIPYHTEQSPVMRARRLPSGSCAECRDRAETSGDMARARLEN